MKRGPKPKPTKLKLLAGNPGKRPLNDAEPKSKPASLTTPAGLSKAEKAHWRKLAPILRDAGLLSRLDTVGLKSICRLEAILDTIVARFPKSPIVRMGKRLVRHPALGALLETLNAQNRLLDAFGMTPSARSRINLGNLGATALPEEKPTDPNEEAKIDEEFFGKGA